MIQTNQYIFIPLIAPLVASSIIMMSKVVKNYPIKKNIIRYTLILSFVITFFFSIFLMIETYNNGSIEVVVGGYQKGIGISYTFTFFSLIIYSIAIIITYISYLYDVKEARKRPTFIAIILIQLSSIMMTISTRDLFNLFVALEVMGITSYILIAFSRDVKASLASFSYLLVSSTLMVFFLIGTYGLYRVSGSLSYEIIAQTLLNTPPSFTIWMSASFIIVPLIVRSAIIGLHFWLPSAHAMAVHPVSALLSGLIIKIPIVALTFLLPIFPFSNTIGSILAVCGIIGACIGVVCAFCQSDAKKLLAYHSVSQMGYIIASCGASFSIGIDSEIGKTLYIASFSHIIFHSLFKSTLFLSIGTTVDCMNNRNVYEIRGAAKKLLGLSKTHSITIISFFVATFSIIALPPFNGFYSKYLISSYMNSAIATTLLFITSSFTVASFIKLSRIFFFMKKTDDTHIIERKHVVLKGRVSVGLLTILLLLSAALGPQLLHILASHLTINLNIGLYSVKNMIKTGATFLLGILFFITIYFSFVKKMMKKIDSMETSLQTMMVFIPVSIALMSVTLFFTSSF